MKKLELYSDKIRNFKYVLLPIALATTITLSSCSIAERKHTNYQNFNSYHDDFEYNNEVSNDEVENQTLVNNSPMNRIQNGNYIGRKINYSNENYCMFLSNLNNINVYYDYATFYNIEKSLDEYYKIKLSITHPNINYSITSDNVYKIIKSNNEEYKKNNHLILYKELSDKDLKEICDLIANIINDFIKNHQDIDDNRIKCIINNLKILNQKSSIANAFVTDDDCLILGTNTMMIANVLMGKNAESDVIIHEIVHLLQKGCKCDIKNNQHLLHNFGISYKFDNVSVNSLDYSWFYESSAEKEMVNYTNDNPITYKNMIGYLESISLTNILNDNYKVNDTEKLSYKHSIEEIYNLFNVTTESDKNEILKLMYSIEVMQMSPDDFYDLYRKNTGEVKNNELIDKINYTLKSDVCQTLSKFFYKNLSNSIIDKEVNLEDIFYLICLYENDMNNHLLYGNDYLYDYNETFINNYVDIQNLFFSNLADSNNMSVDDIIELFNNYTANLKDLNGKTIENHELKFLNYDKKLYLKERQEALKNIAGFSIRDVQNAFNNKEIKK